MKKRMIFWTMGIFFLFGVLCQFGHSQDVKEIIDKSIEAQGGRKALAQVIDSTYVGDMELIQFGVFGSVIRYQKEPNKMRMDIEVQGYTITQAYDGETAWMTNPQTGATEEMPEDLAADTKKGALGMDAILNPEKYGITYSYQKEETIEGINHLIIEQIFEDGEKITLYINGDNYLPYKSITTTVDQFGREVEEETIMGDYREVEGIMVPFSISIYHDGEEFITMTISEVKINSGLEDSLFQMNK